VNSAWLTVNPVNHLLYVTNDGDPSHPQANVAVIDTVNRTVVKTITSGVTWEDYGGSVRVTRIQGMGHGTAVDPGTAPNQCGTAGAYFIDTVCAAYYDVQFFGLDGGSTPPPTTTSTPPPTTASTPPPTTTTTPPTCITSSNYDHVVAGRAYQSGGYAYALGSNQNLGLYNTFYTATLKQSSPGYWEKC